MRIFPNRCLTFERIDRLCSTLAAAVEGFEPEFLVSIDTGGRYVGERLAQALRLPHYRLFIRRDVYDFAWVERLPGIMQALVRAVLFHLTRPVLIRGLPEEVLGAMRGRRVLLVDDAIASGRTMAIGKEMLEAADAEVRTAVLCTVRRKTADYSLIRGMHFYPWSRTSPYYQEYLNYQAHAWA